MEGPKKHPDRRRRIAPPMLPSSREALGMSFGVPVKNQDEYIDSMRETINIYQLPMMMGPDINQALKASVFSFL